MNRLPLAVLSGFGKNTGAALIKQFSASHNVWDSDNSALPSRSRRPEASSDQEVFREYPPGSDRALCSRLRMSMSRESNDLLLSEIGDNLTMRYMDWAIRNYEKQDTSRFEEVPPTSLVILNARNHDYGIKHRTDWMFQLHCACGMLVFRFALGRVPTLKGALPFLKFAAAGSESELLLLHTTGSDTAGLHDSRQYIPRYQFEILARGHAESLRKYDIKVRHSRFIENMLENGKDAQDPEKFAQTLHHLYLRK